MYKNVLTYAVLLVVFGAATLAALQYGTRLYSAQVAAHRASQPPPVGPNTLRRQEPGASPSGTLGKVSEENARDPLSILLLQIIVILLVAKIVGSLLGKVGQPAVVGEMIAGILLGSSVLGVLSPPAMTFLFPPQSLGPLKLLSQVGVIIFMFVVGMELDLQRLRQKAHAAVMVSHTSIVVPLLLGTVFSLFVYRSTAPADITFNAFALFMGVAMSVTAFPVLARILEERGLSKSHLGSTAIACAAVDDATAWCLLAVVVAIVKADGLGSVLFTIVMALLFTGMMLFLLKPYAERLLGDNNEGKTPSGKFVSVALMLVCVSALFTELIGIHALFGAFLAGVIVPSRTGLRTFLTERLGIFTSTLLLPLFFAFTGLRTQINLLDGWSDWVMCAAVIGVAVVGKLGGSMLAARWTGMSWHESISLGVLMNTRGLMELVVLNIGYDLGILSPRVFSMMIIMALTTTFMTGPLLSLLKYWEQREAAHNVQEAVS